MQKPTKKQIVPWTYGFCWSFAVALLDEFPEYQARVVLAHGSPDHAIAIDPTKKFVIDASGVTPIAQFRKRYPGCRISALYKDDDPYYLFLNMMRAYATKEKQDTDAAKLIKEFRDYYDAAKNQESYEITQEDVDNERLERNAKIEKNNKEKTNR